MGTDSVKAKIKIGEKEYPLSLTKREFEKLPVIEKDLNQRIRSLRETYSEYGIQDILTMVLISLSFENDTALNTSLQNTLSLLNQIEKSLD